MSSHNSCRPLMQRSRESASPLASGQSSIDRCGSKKRQKHQKDEEHGTRTHNLGFAVTEEIETNSVT
jgi:hypothetical protein